MLAMLNLEMLYLLVGLATAHVDDDDLATLAGAAIVDVPADSSDIVTSAADRPSDDDEYIDIGI